MERVEDLLLEILKIYQDDELYCFTSDAVLLTHFARVKNGEVVADFCSGSGIVGLHLYGLNKDKIKSVTLFELQENLYNLSRKSIALNNLEDVFTAKNCKVQEIGSEYNGKFSYIVCNPPYQKSKSGLSKERREIAICHEELELTLKELVVAISKALKYGGKMAMVHRADRLVDIVCEMRSNNIEPKRIQFVFSGKNTEPYLVLIEGTKGGKSGLKIEKSIKN